MDLPLGPVTDDHQQRLGNAAKNAAHRFYRHAESLPGLEPAHEQNAAPGRQVGRPAAAEAVDVHPIRHDAERAWERPLHEPRGGARHRDPSRQAVPQPRQDRRLDQPLQIEHDVVAAPPKLA